MILLEDSWYLGMVRDVWRKAYSPPLLRKMRKEEVGKERPVMGVILLLWKVLLEILWESSAHAREGRKVLGSVQCGFIKGQCVFCVEFSLFADEESATAGVHLDFLAQSWMSSAVARSQTS